MGRVILRLECFHDDISARRRARKSMSHTARRSNVDRYVAEEVRLAAMGGTSTYVAKVTGVTDSGRISREFLEGLKDYSNANSVGSRGVYKYYVLTEGPLYEIVDRPGYGKPQRRRYVRVRGGKFVSMSIAEALQCLT